MSTIDPRLDTQLPTSLDALERQRADGLQQRPDGLAEGIGEDQALAPRGPAVDEGEAILTAPAWRDDAAPRLLQAADLPAGFPAGDLALDANVAADSVAAALGIA